MPDLEPETQTDSVTSAGSLPVVLLCPRYHWDTKSMCSPSSSLPGNVIDKPLLHLKFEVFHKRSADFVSCPVTDLKPLKLGLLGYLDELVSAKLGTKGYVMTTSLTSKAALRRFVLPGLDPAFALDHPLAPAAD